MEQTYAFHGRVVKVHLSPAQLEPGEIMFHLQKIHHTLKNVFVVYY